MGIGKWIVGLTAAAGAGEYGIARYFFRRTMIRGNAKQERTQKMAGTDWDLHLPGIRASKEWLAGLPQEDVYITSFDGLKLHGTYFPCEGSKRAVICFHGYTSEGLNDFSSMAKFYIQHGFHLLAVDERAHGKSEGTYIGFGCLDRQDGKRWMEYMVNRLGEDAGILLHGVSMGGATVCMCAGLDLPEQVKGVVSDCAFTSAWEVFSSVLKHTYHMPAFPVMHIADRMAKREAGYGLNECNGREEVKKARVPMLFIHGDGDTFVPCSMAYELYYACPAKKELLVVRGASHAEAYYKDPEKYEAAVLRLMEAAFEKGRD
ncbi:MAG: alpha/beta hydrolase [Clostridium sp.]|nr:alpha/beta hydrolase [Clostridium sp.]